MNATARLASFGVARVVVLGFGSGLGAAIGPDVNSLRRRRFDATSAADT